MKVFLLLHEMLLVIFSFVIPAFGLLLVLTRTREFGVRLNSLDPWAIVVVLFALFLGGNGHHQLWLHVNSH
jgi:hypothetical protein